MKRWLLTSAAGVLLAASAAPAQPPGVLRPTLSPYLNLNRGGLGGINYYGLVRPQIQTNQSLQLLQNEITTGQSVNQTQTDQFGDSGVVGGFQTQWGYFNNLPLQPASLQLAGYGGAGGAGGLQTTQRGYQPPLLNTGLGIGFIAGTGGVRPLIGNAPQRSGSGRRGGR